MHQLAILQYSLALGHNIIVICINGWVTAAVLYVAGRLLVFTSQEPAPGFIDKKATLLDIEGVGRSAGCCAQPTFVLAVAIIAMLARMARCVCMAVCQV